jgi:AcrR family transcriptional regulator
VVKDLVEAGKQRRGEAMVHRVLEVTLQQLAEVGFERLSIPEVAELAGVNKTSIYRRWVTKADLVQAALGHSMGHLRDLPDTGQLATDLEAMVKIVRDFVTSPRGMGVVRTVFADGELVGLPQLAKSMWPEAMQALPRVVIERAVCRGELPASADIEMLLFTLAGAILHRIFVERRDVDDDFARRLVKMVLYGTLERR